MVERSPEVTRYQWVLLDSCDCAIGVMEGTEAEDHVDAVRQFAEFGNLAGTRVIRVSQGTYQRSYYPQMLIGYQCPHKPAKARSGKPPGLWTRLVAAWRGQPW